MGPPTSPPPYSPPFSIPLAAFLQLPSWWEYKNVCALRFANSAMLNTSSLPTCCIKENGPELRETQRRWSECRRWRTGSCWCAGGRDKKWTQTGDVYSRDEGWCKSRSQNDGCVFGKAAADGGKIQHSRSRRMRKKTEENRQNKNRQTHDQGCTHIAKDSDHNQMNGVAHMQAT